MTTKDALEKIEKELIGYNDRGIVEYWEDRQYAKCTNCGEEVKGKASKDWMFGHKGCKKPIGYFVRNDITVEKIRKSIVLLLESLKESVIGEDEEKWEGMDIDKHNDFNARNNLRAKQRSLLNNICKKIK
jgi:hypothetical protein